MQCWAARVWVAPKDAQATISANGVLSVAADCSGGASLQVRKNGTPIWPASGWFAIPAGGSAAFPPLQISVSTGDNLQFMEDEDLRGGTVCPVTWDPVVSFSTERVVHQTTTYAYDGYGRVITTQVSSDDSGSPGSPSTITTRTVYVWNDAVTATATSATGAYLIAFPAYTYTVDEDGKRANCTYTSYDGHTDAVGPQSTFTGRGLATTTETFPVLNATTCGYQASLGFSFIQGQNQWRYQYSTDGESTFQDMTYDRPNLVWRGPATWCELWENGQHPGQGNGIFDPPCDAVRTWVAPSAGTVTVTANGAIRVGAPDINPDGVRIRVLKNGAQIWPASGWQTIRNGGTFVFPPLTTSVAAGDHLQFVTNIVKWDSGDAVTWDPQVDFGAAGGSTTPAAPHTTSLGASYQAAQGFSSTQGQNQWHYQYATDWAGPFTDMTYDSANARWQKAGVTCWIGATWQRPDSSGPCYTVRTWVAPSTGTIMVNTNGPVSVAAGCDGSGVQLRMLKNGVEFWPASGKLWPVTGLQSPHNGSAINFPVLTANVTAGDQLQFVVGASAPDDTCDTTTWNPRVTYIAGWMATTATYDTYGNQLATTDADANAGDSAHTGCTIDGDTTTYSTCTTYDTTFHALPVSATNALNQTARVGYTATAAGGFGLWPISATDANGQTTTTTYDALGRKTSQTLPGETSGLTTTSTTYTDFCAASGAQAPCVEVDQTQRLDDSTTVTSRAFYDGDGRLVETRTPGPDGQDVVQYRYYDPSGREVFASIQYFIAAYTGGRELRPTPSPIARSQAPRLRTRISARPP